MQAQKIDYALREKAWHDRCRLAGVVDDATSKIGQLMADFIREHRDAFTKVRVQNYYGRNGEYTPMLQIPDFRHIFFDPDHKLTAYDKPGSFYRRVYSYAGRIKDVPVVAMIVGHDLSNLWLDHYFAQAIFEGRVTTGARPPGAT